MKPLATAIQVNMRKIFKTTFLNLPRSMVIVLFEVWYTQKNPTIISQSLTQGRSLRRESITATDHYADNWRVKRVIIEFITVTQKKTLVKFFKVPYACDTGWKNGTYKNQISSGVSYETENLQDSKNICFPILKSMRANMI